MPFFDNRPCIYFKENIVLLLLLYLWKIQPLKKKISGTSRNKQLTIIKPTQTGINRNK
jgi:hypothetical protein